MSRLILILLGLVAAVTALPQSAFLPQYCDSLGEEYSPCAYTLEPTCEFPSLKASRTSCFPGCQCREGLVRNYIGKCISPVYCGAFGFGYSNSKN